jgi:hypothetical protein
MHDGKEILLCPYSLAFKPLEFLSDRILLPDNHNGKPARRLAKRFECSFDHDCGSMVASHGVDGNGDVWVLGIQRGEPVM